MAESSEHRVFLAALDPAVRPAYASFAGLDAALAGIVSAAGVGDPIRFLRDLAARLPADQPPERALAAVRPQDLALATACEHQDPAAHARFEAELFGQVDAAFAQFRNASITRDELRQAMRDRLFVGSPPRIASYHGRGDLRAWVRMATVRYLIDVVRAEAARPDRPTGDDHLADAATGSDDPELAFLKAQYRDQFRTAFAQAMTALEPRDRNILRHRYLDGLEVAELATIYGVHRVSMSRSLSRIRDELLAAIRRDFLRRLGVDAGELDGIMTLIASQLELSLSGLLRR